MGFIEEIKVKLSHLRPDIDLDIIIATLLAILMFVISTMFAGLGVDAHHDGILLKPAIDVLNSNMLFRDTFTQYGAFLTYFQALVLAIFGQELLNIRVLTCIMYAVFCFFYYLCLKDILPRLLSILSVILFILMSSFFIWTLLPWSSVYAMAQKMIVAFLLFKFIDSGKYQLLFWAGVVTSLAFYTRQPIGITMFIAIIFLLFNYWFFYRHEHNYTLRKLFLYYVGGTGIVIAVFSLIFIVTGAFRDWWIQSIQFAFVFGMQGRSVVSILHNLFPRWQTAIWILMPVSCILMFLNFYADKISINKHMEKTKININRESSAHDLKLLSLVAVSIASWHQYHPVVCYRHLHWATGIMIGLIIYFIWTIMLRNDLGILRKSVVFALIIVFLFYGDVSRRVETGRARLSMYPYTISYGFHLNGMRVGHRSTYDFFREYFEYIENLKERFPDKGFLNLTRDAMFGVTLTDNLTNMTVNWDDWVYSNYTATINELIERYRPIIILPHASGPHGYVRSRSIGPISIFIDASNAANLVGSIGISPYDRVSETAAIPSGAADGVINFSLDEARILRRLSIQIYNLEGTAIGGWDSTSQSGLWTAFLYADGDFINSTAVTDLNFTLMPGVEYSIFITGLTEEIIRDHGFSLTLGFDDANFYTVLEAVGG